MKLKNLILINSAVIAFNPIFGCGSQLKNSQENTPPNVIIIITDDQGYGDLACNGNPYLKTPNLDKLSKEGIRLTNFHVNSTCSPTRASLMTGRYSIRSGVTSTIGGKSLIRQNEVTMADVFVNSGYRTGMFGKWHLGDNYPFRPEHRGFQEVVSHGGGGLLKPRILGGILILMIDIIIMANLNNLLDIVLMYGSMKSLDLSVITAANLFLHTLL